MRKRMDSGIQSAISTRCLNNIDAHWTDMRPKRLRELDVDPYPPSKSDPAPGAESGGAVVPMQAHGADPQWSEISTDVAFEYQPSSNQSELVRRVMAPGHDVPSHLYTASQSYEVNGSVDADHLEAALQHMAVC